MLCFFVCLCVGGVGDYIDSLVAGWVMIMWYMSDCVILVCVCVRALISGI